MFVGDDLSLEYCSDDSHLPTTHHRQPQPGRRWHDRGFGLPRLLGPERGRGLRVHALGSPGTTRPGLGPQRPDVPAPRRPFVVGYDPTLPAQDNLGSAKPYKQPADGEELDEPNGSFSGQTLYVPGPYKMPGQTIGSDSPPTSNGVFNNNQTYTGCVVDKAGNVFANDIATAQGDYPPPSSGRLVEWFAPNYTTYCIVYGPTSGGTGPHHTDGSGGLAQPGMMALADNGDVLVPNVGTSSVLRFAASSMPASAAQCPGRDLPPQQGPDLDVREGVSFPAGDRQGPDLWLLTPSAATSATRPSAGSPMTASPSRGAARSPARRSPTSGKAPNQYNPFGMAFAPDGTLYFIDIHVVCKALLTGCGPGNYGGRVMKVTFTNGQPSAPVTIARGFDFPTSVTVCVPATQRVPVPDRGRSTRRCRARRRTPLRTRGLRRTRPGTAGFG